MTNQNDASSNWAEDVFAYDDYTSDSAKQNASLKPPVSGYPYLVSESVGALAGAPLYRWVDTEATLATQARMHAQVHSIAQSTAGYAGLLAWAGIDYASLNGGNRIWHNVKWPGVLDSFRVPKPGAAVYRTQLDPAVEPGDRPGVLLGLRRRSRRRAARARGRCSPPTATGSSSTSAART